MSSARLFDTHQRRALLLASGRRCALCATPLSPSGWHADHIVPHSKGGATDVLNGQALCATCNLKKGNAMPWTSLPAWTYDLRTWQQSAFETYNRLDQQDFLLVASPGAGKTVFALRVAHRLLKEGVVERVVVVCPSLHLRKQWADAAHRIGINLHPTWSNGDAELDIADDYHGVCVTYQQIAAGSAAQLHRYHCRRPTLVIFDEIHHAGDDKAFGVGIQQAFAPAVRRLGASGTPFRSDSSPIPFVRYENDVSVADFDYGYGAALDDDAVRLVIFPSYEGRMVWESDGHEFTASFADKLDPKRTSERIRTALDPHGLWIQKAIKEADDKLTEVRANGHPAAGGIIFAMDQTHAKALAARVKAITGSVAAVVTSDDADAHHKIDWFTRSTDRWLIAVRMVSEGVDIPRLRVAVFATNVLTRLHFIQAVGRIIRMVGLEDDETAWFYIPSIPELVQYALELKEIRDHHLKRATESKTGGAGYDPVGGVLSDFYAVESDLTPHDVILHDNSLTQVELEYAGTRCQAVGLPAHMKERVALLLRLEGIGQAITAATPSAVTVAPTKPAPMYARKDGLKKQCFKLVNILAAIHREQMPHLAQPQARIFKQLEQTDGATHKTATEDQLRYRMQVLEQWISEARYAR